MSNLGALRLAFSNALKGPLKINQPKYKLIFGITIPLVVIDQLTKLWAWRVLRGQKPENYLWDFFRFEYAENPGAFLSLGAQLSDTGRLLIFNIAVAFFLVYVAFLLVRKNLPFWHLLAFTLLLGGGFGNLIDRVFRRVVIDFMNMGFGSLRTGIFNVADMAIMAGLLLMIIPEKWLSERTPVAFRAPK